MRAYKGIVENGVIVLIGTHLPEGTVVTVTVSEAELLRVRITNALSRSYKVRGRLKPTHGLTVKVAALSSCGVNIGDAEHDQRQSTHTK